MKDSELKAGEDHKAQKAQSGKVYGAPEIIYQAPLEVRAGSPFGVTDPLVDLVLGSP
jgi:hypothetical protein